MINNPRKFAITWLLEPTAKIKEYTYDYNFKIITYHDKTITMVSNERITYNTFSNELGGYVNRHKKEDVTYTDNFSTIQAQIYRTNPFTHKKEYLGKVEYFDVMLNKGCYYLANYDTQEFISKEYHMYFLSNYSLCCAHLRYYPINSYVLDIANNYFTGNLMRKEEINSYYSPPDVYTSEYLSISEDVSWKYAGNRIHVYGVTYPSFEYKQDTKIETPDGITQNSYVQTIDGDSKIIDFDPAARINSGDFYIYQEQLNTIFDHTINIPDVLVKCSDGLDYNSFVELCNLTSNFKNNTTITFEHD